MDSDVICNDKFEPGKAHAFIRNSGQMKSLSRITYNQHHFRVSRGKGACFNMLDFKWQAPIIDMAFTAFRAAHGHVSARGQHLRRVARADDAGNPELA